MEDIKVYGHITSGISPSTNPYDNGDDYITEAHNICDKGFKELSENITEGSLPIERQDQINRYLYNKEESSISDLTDKLSQETTARENNDALLNANISAVDGRLSSQINDIQDKLNNYKLYSIVASLPTSNIDKNKMYIVASEEGVENNIYTEYIYTENNTWEKLGEFKADIDLDQYVKKTQIADDTRNGLMSSQDKIKLNRIPNPIIRTIDSEVTFSEIQSGKVIEITYTTKNLNTGIDNSRAIYIPTVNSEHIGLMSAEDKIKLDSINDVTVNKISNLPNGIIQSIQDFDNTDAGLVANISAVNLNEDEEYTNDTLTIPIVSKNKAGVVSAMPTDMISRVPYLYAGYVDAHGEGKGEWISPTFGSTKNSCTLRFANNLDTVLNHVTTTNAGVMTADDKTKLDSITNDSLLPNTDDIAEGVSILTVGKTSHAGSTQTSIKWSKLSVGRNGYEMDIKGGNASDNTIITLPPATDNEAGLLPSYLYTTLNNKQAIISNLKLSNDTNTTTSDYIVLTRADYQAILDRLTTLEQQVLGSQNP